MCLELELKRHSHEKVSVLKWSSFYLVYLVPNKGLKTFLFLKLSILLLRFFEKEGFFDGKRVYQSCMSAQLHGGKFSKSS
jgi:hypothetical protein